MSKRARSAGPNVEIRKSSSHAGEYAGVSSISGEIIVDTALAGRWKATLINRTKCGSQFHAACDAESSELQEVGVKFCDSRGRCRLSALSSCSAASSGDFVYIDSFSLNEEHRQDGATAIGADAVRQLLKIKQFKSVSLAVYIPEGRGAQGSAERDARQFLRAGFQQANELVENSNCAFLYCTQADLAMPMKSHDEAIEIPFGQKAKGAAAPAGLDKELFELLCCEGMSNVGVRGKIQRLVQRGASVSGSHSLHGCVANFDTHGEYVELLASLEPGCINSLDQTNVTPLMIAANLTPGTASKDRPASSASVTKLLELGADKELVNTQGLTAYGCFRTARRDISDFKGSFGLPADSPAHAAALDIIDAMLRPSQPTQKDLAALEPAMGGGVGAFLGDSADY